MVEMLNISKSFGDKPVLKNFSLQVNNNESVCVMGESGRGKTTVLNILSGILKPDSGIVKGTENLRVSVVFQEDRLCENLSVGANIRLVLNEYNKSDVLNMLSIIGLDKEINTPCKELSGGMKRRVAILRALAVESDLVIMDEPFKGLDYEMKRLVIDFALEKCKNRTVIFSSHSEEDATLMKSRVFVMASNN